MLYIGILAIGLGILASVAGLICLAVSGFSHEIAVRQKCKKLATRILPVAVLLLFFGTGVVEYVIGFD